MFLYIVFVLIYCSHFFFMSRLYQVWPVDTPSKLAPVSFWLSIASLFSGARCSSFIQYIFLLGLGIQSSFFFFFGRKLKSWQIIRCYKNQRVLIVFFLTKSSKDIEIFPTHTFTGKFWDDRNLLISLSFLICFLPCFLYKLLAELRYLEFLLKI